MMTDEEFKLLREVHQGLYGVKGTEEKGLLGDFKDLSDEFKTHCKDNDKTKTVLYWLIGVLIGAGVLTGGSIGIVQLIS